MNRNVRPPSLRVQPRAQIRIANGDNLTPGADYASNSPIIVAGGQGWNEAVNAASEKAWFASFSSSVSAEVFANRRARCGLALTPVASGRKHFPGRSDTVLVCWRGLVTHWPRRRRAAQVALEALVSSVCVWRCEYEPVKPHESFVRAFVPRAITRGT